MSKEMTFLDHLDELRWRILKIFLGMIIPIVLAMMYYVDLFQLLMLPIQDASVIGSLLELLHLESLTPEGKDITLQAIHPTDTFLTALKIAITTGLFCSLPNVIYQIWMFVAPALTSNEKKYTLPVIFFASFFFIIGSSFAYFIVTPFAFNFLSGFGEGLVQNQWGVSQYYDLVLKLLLTFGLVFELPCVAFVMARLGLIKASTLRKFRKHAVVTILALSAILTPPDVVTQVMMAVPLYILFEFSIWIVAVFRKTSPLDED